ncbi:hypothetical protein L596_013751 [Steinernema carpocapsae]|uniref:Uncharacterized protein n=1 Tax=Steinernema carpocapsae TaxID=34508 RepID=A0A4U5P146_STECR|nr:hypothetical protein L596_013751 [Steinernema carpocapsae]
MALVYFLVILLSNITISSSQDMAGTTGFQNVISCIFAHCDVHHTCVTMACQQGECPKACICPPCILGICLNCRCPYCMPIKSVAS